MQDKLKGEFGYSNGNTTQYTYYLPSYICYEILVQKLVDLSCELYHQSIDTVDASDELGKIIDTMIDIIN